MIRQIPVSVEDFRKLREKNFEYIDKTHLITELIDRASYKVVLLPRPRRFGKCPAKWENQASFWN